MKLPVISSLLLLHFTIYAQTFSGSSADKLVKESKEIHYSKKNGAVPDYIKLNTNLPVNKLKNWVKSSFKMGKEYGLVSFRTTTDLQGYSHTRFQQMFSGIPVEGNVFVVHSKNDHVVSMNGNLINDLGKINLQSKLTEKEALLSALKHVGAKKYRWEGKKQKNSETSRMAFYPKGEKTIIETKSGSKVYRLAYKFDVYAEEPLSRAYIYVDALSGEVINEINRICHIRGDSHAHTDEDKSLDDTNEEENHHHRSIDATGSANTMYSGIQTITADSYPGGYRLRESGRGIETYDLNTGTDYFNAVDFVNSDNNWNETLNFDNAAYDAHWGAEVTYDYYLNTFNRDGIDGAGSTMLSYIHYSSDYDNAFWDGERMTYGDGSNSPGRFTPLPALDVVGHEFTHGVTEYTANLIYAGESGALNEAFSDIFGTVIEFNGKPGDANFDMGEDVMFSGGALRSLSNPNTYGNPDTYEGDFWDPNEVVHTNSGVAGFWFYLLSEGGSGTNDNGSVYNVSGLGIDKAAAIAYRTLSVYLTPVSDYATARYYSIKSAVDLYGSCSPEVAAVTNAWYAVGVGGIYSPVVVADFTSSDTVYCSTPASVNFTNLSSNADSFVWNFGDGTATTTIENPVHSYTSFGTYTVSLSADGGTCGSDAVSKTAYITVSSTATCITRIPTTGTGSLQTACDGILFDDGGPTQNYSNGTNGTITIQPSGANAVLLTFDDFEFENGYDYINIYDGPNVSSPVLGTYTGLNLPEDGEVISSSGGAMTLQQFSDESVTGDGFSASWTCLNSNSGPLVRFDAVPRVSCDGVVQFNDQSLNNPISWSWDFGDGTTSSEGNPLKVYSVSGTFNVELEVCNANSCDVLTINSYVTVNLGGACDVIIPKTGSEVIQTACTGVVKDDGGDEDYSNGSNGSVTISPIDATSITLTFNSFEMESDYDYLYIYDGPNTSSPLIGAFSGSSLPGGGSVTSSGGSITLFQVSDGSVVGNGFECSWLCSTEVNTGDSSISIPASGTGIIQTECSGVLKDNGGDLNYSNNTDGSITISPTGATSVILSFSSFDMESGYDNLYVYDGPNASSPLLGVFTGATIPNAISSTGGSITVRQDTDGSVTRSGFQAEWLCDTSGSGVAVLIPASGIGVVQTECSGVLEDNGGDGNYSNSTNGSITISPTGATSVTLSFNSFQFESCCDALYIYDGSNTSSPLLGVFTGATIPNAITSTGGSITVRQETDGSVTESGFQAEWSCSIITDIADAILDNSITIYPNPTDDAVKIDFGGNNTSFIHVSLINVLQVVVMEKEVTSNETTLDVSDLASGLYYINIDNKVIRKLIVK